MSILFGYESALTIYQAMANPERYPSGFVDLADMDCEKATLLGTPWEKWERLAKPAQLIVETPADVRHNALAHGHAWGGKRALWPALDLGNGAFVSDPAWTFLQMAQHVSEPELTFVGCELTSSYACVGETLVARRPPCEPREMRAFLAGCGGRRGARKATSALCRVLAGARSPMEIALALCLTLPVRSGGYGLPQPELNRTLALGEHGAAILGVDHITPDLYWRRARLAVEYDSDSFHAHDSQIACDARRRLALETMGVQVITVTNEQMRSVRDLDGIAHEIERRLGHRMRYVSAAGEARRSELQARLRQLAGRRVIGRQGEA